MRLCTARTAVKNTPPAALADPASRASWNGWSPDLANTRFQPANVARLTEPHEKALIRRLTYYPELLETAARDLEPHQLAHYLRDLAGDFHTYYNAHKFIVDDAALRAYLTAMGAQFEWVIVDGPPALESPESVNLAPIVDGVVLVVRSGLPVKEMLEWCDGRYVETERQAAGPPRSALDHFLLGAFLQKEGRFEDVRIGIGGMAAYLSWLRIAAIVT